MNLEITPLGTGELQLFIDSISAMPQVSKTKEKGRILKSKDEIRKQNNPSIRGVPHK